MKRTRGCIKANGPIYPGAANDVLNYRRRTRHSVRDTRSQVADMLPTPPPAAFGRVCQVCQFFAAARIGERRLAFVRTASSLGGRSVSLPRPLEYDMSIPFGSVQK